MLTDFCKSLSAKNLQYGHFLRKLRGLDNSHPSRLLIEKSVIALHVKFSHMRMSKMFNLMGVLNPEDTVDVEQLVAMIDQAQEASKLAGRKLRNVKNKLPPQEASKVMKLAAAHGQLLKNSLDSSDGAPVLNLSNMRPDNIRLPLGCDAPYVASDPALAQFPQEHDLFFMVPVWSIRAMHYRLLDHLERRRNHRTTTKASQEGQRHLLADALLMNEIKQQAPWLIDDRDAWKRSTHRSHSVSTRAPESPEREVPHSSERVSDLRTLSTPNPARVGTETGRSSSEEIDHTFLARTGSGSASGAAMPGTVDIADTPHAIEPVAPPHARNDYEDEHPCLKAKKSSCTSGTRGGRLAQPEMFLASTETIDLPEISSGA